MTFRGGQLEERLKPDVANFNDLPKWMQQYVTIPVKRSEMAKFQEVDFIKASRDKKHKQESVTLQLAKSHPEPLIHR